MKNVELPECLAKRGISRNIKEFDNNDKDTFRLPRQDSENQGVIVKGLKLSPILGHSSAYLGKGCSSTKKSTTVLLRMTECKPRFVHSFDEE